MGPLYIDYVVADVPSNPSFPWQKTGMPPLGISLLKAMTPTALDGYTIVARCHHERTMGRYDVATQRPDIVALSIYTPSARRAYALADECRGITSQHGRPIRVLAGGHHATALPLEAMHHADAVARGECTPELLEAVLRWCVRQIECDGTEKRIFELRTINHGSIRRPAADRSWYPASRYYNRNMLQTSSGCPFACSFCSVTYGGGAHVRAMDDASLEAEVRALRPNGVTMLYDDNFVPTPDGAHARRVCEVLRRNRVAWRAELTPVTLLPHMRELLPLFARSGCRSLLFGFESVRGGSGKILSGEAYGDLIRCCHDHGIPVIGCFVFGVHEDDDERIFDETVAWANAMHCDFCFFAVNTPFPGSPAFETAVRDNLLTDWNWAHYDVWHPVRRFRHISAEAMYTGVRNAYRWHYGSEAVWERTLARLGELWPPSGGWMFPRLQSILLAAVTGNAIGASREMRCRQDMRYTDYLGEIDAVPNPHVLAQFAVGKPLDQYNARQRIQELCGKQPGRTTAMLGPEVPLTLV